MELGMTALASPYLLLRRDGEARVSRAQPLGHALEMVQGANAPSPERRGGMLRTDVSRIIAARNFKLALQPVVRMEDLRPVGHEALLRLRPPPGASAQSTRGFVDLAQEWGFGTALDEAVLDAALATWGQTATTPVSVNIAARSLRDPVFFARLAGRVAGEGGRIAIEITGVAEFDDVPATVAAVAALRAAGVPVVLDDFGPGDAMLACLQAARFDDVKLAGAVVGEAVAAPRGEKLLVALVKAAEAAGARVVAKLVETEPQAARLRALGVVYGQGWLFGAPVLPPPLRPSAPIGERRRVLEPA
jgi:EAL domain-containing protein (putative c-di-GMP-specific phosphodiesterase class I)